jgi:hypothetical protein
MKIARLLPALFLFLAASAPSRAIEFPCSEICSCARDCYQICISKTGGLTTCGSTGKCAGGSKCPSPASASLAAIFGEGSSQACALPAAKAGLTKATS